MKKLAIILLVVASIILLAEITLAQTQVKIYWGEIAGFWANAESVEVKNISFYLPDFEGKKTFLFERLPKAYIDGDVLIKRAAPHKITVDVSGWITIRADSIKFNGGLHYEPLTYGDLFIGIAPQEATIVEFISDTVSNQGVFSFLQGWRDTRDMFIINEIPQGSSMIVYPEAYYSTCSDENELMMVPGRFYLYQNYPNPFNPQTTITFTLSKPDHVSLKVYDVLGREIKTLVNAWLPAGEQKAVFDAGDLVSGNYFYRLETDGLVVTKRMTIVK